MVEFGYPIASQVNQSTYNVGVSLWYLDAFTPGDTSKEVWREVNVQDPLVIINVDRGLRRQLLPHYDLPVDVISQPVFTQMPAGVYTLELYGDKYWWTPQVVKEFPEPKPTEFSVLSHDDSDDQYKWKTIDGLLAKYVGPSHEVTFWSASDSGKGMLTSSPSFTFGDQASLGALRVPSLQAVSSIVVGNRDGFWDGQYFTMDYSSIGGQIRITPGYSNTKYFFAHNNEGNASVVTDKASFGNLSNNGIVFASMLPNTSEELIYLHTDDGFSYSPLTKTATVNKLAIGSFNTEGVVINDPQGNIKSVPYSSLSGDCLVTKVGHGFFVGEPVRLDIDASGAQSWSAAYADSTLNHTATHYVVDVIDANTFRAACSGYRPLSPASPVYGQQILGPTPGSVVASVMDLPHEVGIQPLGMLDATGLHINILSYVRDITP